MDNYLAYRWPSGQIGQPEPPGKPKKENKRGRRVWRDLLIVLLALVMLGTLALGSFLGVQYAAEQYLADQAGGQTGTADRPGPSDAGNTGGGTGSGDSEDPRPSRKPHMPDKEDVDEDWTPDLLPWGDPDPSVQLELLSRTGTRKMEATDIYEKVLPSIVYVQAATDEEGAYVGTGIVISESGYIITNYHIIEGGIDLQVMLVSDWSVYDATLIGYDKELDLAVLKADGEDFVPAELGDSDELRVGDPVYAIGNPLGYLYGVMTEGIVSALGDRNSELDYPGRLILTSASLNSGNSGGALVDAYGRVIGITNAKLTGVEDDVVVEGLGLAIPMTDARPYLNRILRTGNSARPSLGIMCLSPVTQEVRPGEFMTGIEVDSATEGTPAYGKLVHGDLIIACNGVTVETVDDMSRILSELDPGDVVTLTVMRSGKQITVTVELYDRLSELQ